MSKLLYEGADWDFDTLRRIDDACADIAINELGLSVYPNQIEIVTSEQMLDGYASIGLPLMYKHWSFGKHFAQQEAMYRRGMMGLAYELVINSSPCIAYLMEENTATMQTLVIAHACYGHNHFFKNNYLFKQWTDASGILDYIEFAKNYIAKCEERYGLLAVETTLDAAHALRGQGVHRHSGKKRKPDIKEEEKRAIRRALEQEASFDDIWRTLPKAAKGEKNEDLHAERRREILGLPEENLLYFLEKYSPRLQTWQRELLRIVRMTAQYFHPQGQTKVMNEGCATFVHHKIIEGLRQKGQISDGNYQEFLMSHTNVVKQPNFDERGYGGINPYALGFAMCRDIEGIVTGQDESGNPRTSEQLAEDKEWFPDIAGKGDEMAVLRDIWANYRDESFIRQFLSPRLIRSWRLFHLHDDTAKDHFLVTRIHDERGYRHVRKMLADNYDYGVTMPNIEVRDVDLEEDRKVLLTHEVRRHPIERKDAEKVIQHFADLWGYDARFDEVGTGVTVAPGEPIEKKARLVNRQMWGW